VGGGGGGKGGGGGVGGGVGGSGREVEEEWGRRDEDKEGERRDGKWFGGGMNKEGKIRRTDT
jgi:hypothetical protein